MCEMKFTSSFTVVPNDDTALFYSIPVDLFLIVMKTCLMSM